MDKTLATTKPPLIHAWLMAVRLRTLAIPFIQVAASLAYVYSAKGSIDWVVAFLTLMVGICVTIQVNLFNDVFDFAKGGDSLMRHGHLKVIPAGFLTEKQVFRGAVFFGCLMFLFGIPLMMKGGGIVTAILIVSILCAYGYTGGPLPICYLGLNELFVLLFYGFVCVVTTFYLQVGYVDASVLLVATQMGLFACLPAAINNFRDQEEDAKANKRNLIVRFGKTFGRWEITLLTFFPLVLGSLWAALGYPMATAMPLLNFPLSLLLVRLVWKTDPGPIYNRYFALCVLVHVAFGLLLGLGLNW